MTAHSDTKENVVTATKHETNDKCGISELLDPLLPPIWDADTIRNEKIMTAMASLYSKLDNLAQFQRFNLQGFTPFVSLTIICCLSELLLGCMCVVCKELITRSDCYADQMQNEINV